MRPALLEQLNPGSQVLLFFHCERLPPLAELVCVLYAPFHNIQSIPSKEYCQGLLPTSHATLDSLRRLPVRCAAD